MVIDSLMRDFLVDFISIEGLLSVNVYTLIVGLILSIFVQKQDPEDAYN